MNGHDLFCTHGKSVGWCNCISESHRNEVVACIPGCDIKPQSIDRAIFEKFMNPKQSGEIQ